MESRLFQAANKLWTFLCFMFSEHGNTMYVVALQHARAVGKLHEHSTYIIIEYKY